MSSGRWRAGPTSASSLGACLASWARRKKPQDSGGKIPFVADASVAALDAVYDMLHNISTCTT
jgi:hypothetical protein